MSDASDVTVVDPFEQEAIRLLLDAASTWTPYDAEASSALTDEAVRHLCWKAILESRHACRIGIVFDDGGREEEVTLRVRITGDDRSRLALGRAVFGYLPRSWFTPEGKTAGRIWVDLGAILALRLTVEGERARSEELAGDPIRAVRSFLFFPSQFGAPAFASVEPTPAEANATGGQGTAQAAAFAQASIGDITVQNHITVDAAAIVREFEKARLQTGESRDATPVPPDDDSAYVEIGKLWRDRFGTYRKCETAMKNVPDAPGGIRRRRNGRQRLLVHAGDWARYWSEQDRQTFDALDGESADEARAEIEARKAEARSKKRRE